MSQVDELNKEIDAKIADKIQEGKSTELATTGVNDFAPPELLQGFQVQSWSNFPSDKKQRWQLISRATGANVQAGDDWIGKEFDVRYYFAHTVRFNGKEEGEFIDGIRTVLVDPDGKMIAFGSDGIAQSLSLLVQCFGTDMFEPPVRVKVTRQKTRSGNQIFKLEAADEQP